MKALIAALLLASPAAAWEASRKGPVCLLTHATDKGDIIVAHDPRRALPYSIDLGLAEGWKAGPEFFIKFDGLGARVISTQRHVLTEDGSSLSVADVGFGNVLDGLAQNFVALAVSGETAMVIPLSGAAPEVEKFKACAAAAGV